MTRFLILMPLLFVTMGIGSCASRRLASLDAGDGCEYAGMHREAGSRFPSTDGCNTCSCGILFAGQLVEAGKVYCSLIACLSDAGGSGDLGPDAAAGCDQGGVHHAVGSTFPSTDGCNDCICVADGQTSCSMRACNGSYSACQFGSGIGRVLIAKLDAPRNLCGVLILDRPGTNSFGLTVPSGWGVEAAFVAAAAGSDCQWISPPVGAVLASAATGRVTITNTSIDVNAMLTFPPNTLGVASEYLVASALDSTPTCSTYIGP